MRSLRTLRRALAAVAVVIAVGGILSAANVSVHAQPLPGESLFVRASVNNHRPYLGQQITYTFRVYQSSGLALSSGTVRYEPPGFAGFWNNQAVEQDQYPETIDSVEYQVIELRTLLFPSVVGTAAIDPPVWRYPPESPGPKVCWKVPPLPSKCARFRRVHRRDSPARWAGSTSPPRRTPPQGK